MSSRQLDLPASGAKSDPPKESGKGGGGRRRGGPPSGGGDEPPPPPADASLATEAQRRYLNYAVSVITSRALPDVRDGLKPVQRRILYAMYANLHLYPDVKHRKCAQIVGEVLGKFHPHGDTSCLRRDGAHGAGLRAARTRSSTGTATSARSTATPPAAYRYTEARLAPLATELLDELSRGRSTSGPTTTAPPRSRSCCRRAPAPARQRHAPASPSAWRPTSRRTTWTRCSTRRRADRRPRARDQGPAQVHQGPRLPDRRPDHERKKELREIYEAGQGGVRVRGEWKIEERQERRRAHRHHLDPLRA